MNYIVMTVFTLSMAFMVGGTTAWLTPVSVLMAVGTLAVILVCLFLAMLATPNKPKAVLGVCIGILAACILQLVIMIPLMIAGAFEGIYIMYCMFGILIASGLIYIDLFLIMMAGKVASDEYILAAILLYIDIIRLLFYLLLMFGKRK
jgi:FtsH-binding integral membrane protein